MAKKSITWIELINVKISEHKKAGKPAGVSDVMGEAKADWAKIKAGSHPDYEPGKSTGPKTRKSKANKTKKDKANKTEKTTTSKHKMSSSSSMAEHLESCEKCMKIVKRHMKKGGGNCGETGELPSPPTYPLGDPVAASGVFGPLNTMTGGDCGCAAPPATPMMGGKKHSKKNRK